ncbi:MAG TPA: tetratricopeptide repeat protein [Flavobacteriia bacterium]|nr:tetratricopeptide repeat protein [Flavobacteriia bacterium]
MKPFCFLLIPIFIFSQNVSEKQQLQAAIDTTSTISDKVTLYADLAWEYIIIENDSALLIANKSLTFSKENNYKLGEAISLETKGLYYEAVKGDYSLASKFYFEGIKICEANDLAYATSIYHSLGVMFHTSDNYKKAKEYYTIAYKRAKAENNLSLQKKCLVNLGSVNSSLKNYNEAEKLLLESLNINVQREMDFSIYANLGNLYIRQKKYKKAIPFLEKATVQHPDNTDSEEHLSFLIDAKTALKDSANMKPILKRAINYANESNALRKKSIMILSISNYYTQFGDYKKALNYRDEYLYLYEEIKKRQRDETVYELETRYQTEKKEREIAEQNLIIVKKNRQKNQILFGLISVGILSIGLFIFFKKRIKYQKTIAVQTETLQQQKIIDLQQKNKLIALNSMIEGQEVERLRIAKDLHDSLGGLLSTIKAYFVSIQKKVEKLEGIPLTKKTNQLIDEACLEVRRISHNMMPHSLSISGLQSAIEDLGQQLREQGYQVTVEINNLPTNISDTKKVMIYRLIQEIISNMRKHAQAKNILIQLLGYKNELNLIIEDDGKGFNYSEARKNNGLGLKSINSRVEFLDGIIHWDTQHGNGTTITINIPLL